MLKRQEKILKQIPKAIFWQKIVKNLKTKFQKYAQKNSESVCKIFYMSLLAVILKYGQLYFSNAASSISVCISQPERPKGVKGQL